MVMTRPDEATSPPTGLQGRAAGAASIARARASPAAGRWWAACSSPWPAWARSCRWQRASGTPDRVLRGGRSRPGARASRSAPTRSASCRWTCPPGWRRRVRLARRARGPGRSWRRSATGELLQLGAVSDQVGGEPTAEVSITLGRDLAVDGRLRPGDTVDVYVTEDEGPRWSPTGSGSWPSPRPAASFGRRQRADRHPGADRAGRRRADHPGRPRGRGHPRAHHPPRPAADGRAAPARGVGVTPATSPAPVAPTGARRMAASDRGSSCSASPGSGRAWFADVARWATSATIPVDFVKVVSRRGGAGPAAVRAAVLGAARRRRPRRPRPRPGGRGRRARLRGRWWSTTAGPPGRGPTSASRPCCPWGSAPTTCSTPCARGPAGRPRRRPRRPRRRRPQPAAGRLARAGWWR